jgi:RpiR family carbohydrate utilization transcriptional regulator
MLGIIATKLEKQEFRKSEAKVATAILSDPEAAVSSSIARLAKAADVSEPSVNRFCTNLGCKGFPDFKIQLARSIDQGVSFIGNNVTLDDDTSTIANKIFDASIATIKSAKETMDRHALERAIDILAQARKIDFYGLGASGSVALDAQHKFFRLNIPVVAHVDVMMQRMSAAGAHMGEAIVLISNTGRTRQIVDVAAIAKQAGASTIGITTPNTPLAKHCDLVLAVDPHDDSDHYTPTTSRLAHLVVIDILATGIALKRGPQFTEHLKCIKNALQETRHPKK